MTACGWLYIAPDPDQGELSSVLLSPNQSTRRNPSSETIFRICSCRRENKVLRVEAVAAQDAGWNHMGCPQMVDFPQARGGYRGVWRFYFCFLQLAGLVGTEICLIATDAGPTPASCRKQSVKQDQIQKTKSPSIHAVFFSTLHFPVCSSSFFFCLFSLLCKCTSGTSHAL